MVFDICDLAMMVKIRTFASKKTNDSEGSNY